MTTFNLAQTFFVDPTNIGNATQVLLTSVKLYFRAKPRNTGNKSGIFDPGVQIAVVPCQYSIPVMGQAGINQQLEWARANYGTISVSADGTQSTLFSFYEPQPMYSGVEYAIVVKFDGDEDFLLWTNKQGDYLVGTNTPSPGASGRYIGKLYSYISPTGATTGTGIGYSQSISSSNNSAIPLSSSQLPQTIQLSQEYLLSTWRPIDNTDLKFDVFVARYFHNGVPVISNTTIMDNPTIPVYETYTGVTVLANNVMRVSAASLPVEFVQYDKTVSLDTPLSFGTTVYQDQPYWTGGKQTPATVSVTNTTIIVAGNASFTLANGSAFNWNYIFANTSEHSQSIVVTSLNHDGAGLHRVNVRTVREIANGNLLGINEPFTFVNTVARFFAAPSARVNSKLKSFAAAGKLADMITFSDTNSNSTCRFANNRIEAVTVTANGQGYSNSDYLNISGFETVAGEVYGGYMATANIITNASGNITSISVTNCGCGFVNTSWLAGANIVVANSTGGSSAGSGATFTYTVDSTIKTEGTTGTYFKGCKVINLDALQIVPLLGLNVPSGTGHTVTHRTLYHSETTANTASGKKYLVNNDSTLTDFVIQNGKVHNFAGNLIPCIVSRSNQFAIRYANGYAANSDIIGKLTSNSAIYTFDISSNNDFTSVSASGILFTSTFAKYIINNDYTNEHTNYGNAWAKHVMTKVNFADGRAAEDMIVYLTGFRPIGTDFKVYTRIYNSDDEDTFDLKDYTLLEQTDGLGVYSNPNNPVDFKEYTYNFSAYGNTDYISPGSVTTTLSSNAIVGTNTNFTANLAVNDVVRIYQPLFPNNYMVSTIGTITDNTSITFTEPISNNGMVGSGLKLARIKYPKQAYNDILNSNVVTYYSGTGAKITTYDTFQVKVIFLSNNDSVIPKLDDVRVVGTSA